MLFTELYAKIKKNYLKTNCICLYREDKDNFYQKKHKYNFTYINHSSSNSITRLISRIES